MHKQSNNSAAIAAVPNRNKPRRRRLIDRPSHRYFKVLEEFIPGIWRTIVSAETQEGAREAFERTAKIRRAEGYAFFALRFVKGPRGSDSSYDSRTIADWQTWEEIDW